MAMLDVGGFAKRYQQLAVGTALGTNAEEELEELTAHLVNSAKAVSPTDWMAHVRAVRGRLKVSLTSLEVHEPSLPNKLFDPMNHAQRIFFNEAIGRLSRVLGSVE